LVFLNDFFGGKQKKAEAAHDFHGLGSGLFVGCHLKITTKDFPVSSKAPLMNSQGFLFDLIKKEALLFYLKALRKRVKLGMRSSRESRLRIIW
jgi:hypothetical protein